VPRQLEAELRYHNEILRAFADAMANLRQFARETGARDAVGVSLAIEHIGPILMTVVMVLSALALAGLAGYAGCQPQPAWTARFPHRSAISCFCRRLCRSWVR
jgi:hypothetical protein